MITRLDRIRSLVPDFNLITTPLGASDYEITATAFDNLFTARLWAATCERRPAATRLYGRPFVQDRMPLASWFFTVALARWNHTVQPLSRCDASKAAIFLDALGGPYKQPPACRMFLTIFPTTYSLPSSQLVPCSLFPSSIINV